MQDIQDAKISKSDLFGKDGGTMALMIASMKIDALMETLGSARELTTNMIRANGGEIRVTRNLPEVDHDTLFLAVGYDEATNEDIYTLVDQGEFDARREAKMKRRNEKIELMEEDK